MRALNEWVVVAEGEGGGGCGGGDTTSRRVFWPLKFSGKWGFGLNVNMTHYL